MKRMRKLAAVTAGVMACGMLGWMPVLAETVTSGTCGENLTWEFDADTGTLTISGEGEMEDYSSSTDAPWYSNWSHILTVNIEYGTTHIGAYAFSSTPLTDIIIPDSVTSIGNSAFRDCKSLKEITLPSSVTSIGGYAFADCRFLTEIIVPDGVTSIEAGTFWDCFSLTVITIPNSVTSIGQYAFISCTSLTEIVIPESVTSIGGYAFNNCKGLMEITILNPQCNLDDSLISTSKIYGYIGSTAQKYAERNDISFVALNPGAVIEPTIVANGTCGDNLAWTLDDVGTLTISGEGEMEITSYDSSPWYGVRDTIKTVVIASGVTSVGAFAFADSKSLTEITIPNSVTSIGNLAFYYCVSLTEITIPNSVTSIGSLAFYHCVSLTEITIPNSVTSIGGSTFSDCNNLTVIIIPDSLTSIRDGAFDNCQNLAEITIPDSIASIGVVAFCDCDSLTEITIPNSVTSIGDYAFSGCDSLTEIIIPDSVINIGDEAFANCTNLTIYGYNGTCAETYANDYSIPFISLGEIPAYEPGDINRDGEITLSDAILLARLLAEDIHLRLTTAALENADVNGDGILQILDLRMLLTRLADA